MTTPTSGAITIGNVASEFQYGLPLTLGDARMRNLVNTPSGQIELGQFRGLTYIPPSTAGGGGGPIGGQVNQPYGTVLGTTCSGVNLYGVYADGNGGTYQAVYAYKSYPCWAPPAAGTFLYETCSGGNLIDYYADGNGGSYAVTNEYNSRFCYTDGPPDYSVPLGGGTTAQSGGDAGTSGSAPGATYGGDGIPG